MSIKVMEWVFQNSKSQGLERLILLVIADHCNSEGEDAFPRISVIAKRANVSERTAQRKIQDLVNLGELEVVNRVNTSNLYKIVVPGFNDDKTTEPQLRGQEANSKPKTRAKRERNPIWDALLISCNVDPDNVNSSEGSRYGKLVKVLKESEATPDEIFARAQAYRQKFPQATLTPTALVNRWSECDPSRLEMNGLKGVVPQGWNAIKAAREQRELAPTGVKGELNVG